MFTATFTFAAGAFDDQFHAMDQAIAEVARATPGYLGEESWENPTNRLVSTVYYWDTLEALQTLMQHPTHQAAKARQQQWLNGYQVVIAQVLANYGDGGIAHPLAGRQLPAGLVHRHRPGRALAAPPG
jgi:heme-degrading monooxygenase HmoA